MSVRVLQNPRLVVSDINLMPEAFRDAGISIPGFYNMGKSTLYNLMVKVEMISRDKASVITWELEPEGRTFRCVIFPDESECKTKHLFTFEDANGKIPKYERNSRSTLWRCRGVSCWMKRHARRRHDGAGMEGMPGGGKKAALSIIPAR